jgi:hypothetical protein
MAIKNIASLSDEEIEALSPEELLELQTGDERVDDGEEEEEEEAPAGGTPKKDDAGEEEEEEEEEVPAGEEEEEPDPLTDEKRLSRLLENEEAGDDVGDIPYSRFKSKVDEANDLRLLLRTVLQRDGKIAAPVAAEPDPKPEEKPAFTYDFKKAQREYIALVDSGKEEEANAKLDEIEDARETMTAERIAKATEATRNEMMGELAYREVKIALDRSQRTLYKEFPFLDNTSKDRDDIAIIATNARAKQLVAAGKPPAEALLEAGRAIGKRFAKAIEPPKGKDTPKPVLDKDGKEIVDKRTQSAVRRNLDVRQPATLKAGSGSPNNTGKINIRDLTDEQLEKMEKSDPEALAELRGDRRVANN